MLKMYSELASWWPLLSPPSEYVDEARFYAEALTAAASDRPPRTLLELGSGGGNNASHLKQRFEMLLVDPSPEMRALSQALNPECEHVDGDMRSVRLDRTLTSLPSTAASSPFSDTGVAGVRLFDAVFIHDAICYMATEEDLRRAIETAFVHCRPGGVALFAPDYVREHFATATDHGGSDAEDGRGLRYLEWVWDPDPDDDSYVVDYALMLRAADGQVHVEHDRHVEGLFARAHWLRLLAAAGFDARMVLADHDDLDPTSREIFVATRPR